ncbi:MAG: cellulase family glycosylhydrolase [Deltaproteobacteria bacterium]|nr:cellulase family glycosylhydrolase [Deltaproteobacteria bacterium]
MSPSRWRAALSLAIPAALATLAGPAAAFTWGCPFGVNAHQASNAALDKVAAAGIGWVRFDMNWFQLEPKQGQYDWQEPDRFIDHATGLGLHVFVTVAYSPKWAVAGPCNDNDPNKVNWCRNRPPTNPAFWTSFLTAAVKRYQGKVKHWGMWNEPNLSSFYTGTRDQYVADILKPGSAAVHAACGDCKVLGPELAHLRGADWDSCEGQCLGCQCAFNGWNFSLIKVLEAAGAQIDIITHHKYTDPALTFWQEMCDGETVVIKIQDGVKEVTDKYAPGKSVWITELGWESEPFGKYKNDYAAGELTKSYQWMSEIVAGSFPSVKNKPWPELAKLFWYDLHDDPNGYSWGLLTSNIEEKAPYQAYKDVIQKLGDCSGGGGAGGAGGSGGSGSSASSTGSSSTSSTGSSSGGGTSTGSSSGGGAGTGGAGTGGGAGATSSGAPGAPVRPGGGEGGCGCVLVPRSGGAPGAVGLLVGLLLLCRRRQRR